MSAEAQRDPAADSEEADEQSAPGLVARALAIPRRITVAGWAALATAVFLLLLVLAAWTLLVLDPNIPVHTLTWTRIVVVVVLLIAIPVVQYYAVRLWMEGDTARFPDIDFAWNAGLRSLARSGISLRRTPLFVLLGPNDSRHERAIVRAAGLGLRVRGEPEGPAPLHWYANPEGVYLFLTEVGLLSELASVMSKREAELLAGESPQAVGEAAERTAAGPPSGSAPQAMPQTAPPADAAGPGASTSAQLAPRPTTPTPPPANPAPAGSAAAPQNAAAGRGTVSLDEYLRPPQQAPPAAATPGRGTVTINEPLPREAVPRGRSAGAPEDQPSLVAPQRAAEQIERLDYLCRLLRRVREPMCGSNGVVALLPFHAIQSGEREAHELEQAVRTDLATVQRSLQLRCPVTALVDGMQRERGFHELVRRVGPQRAAVQRFGRRYDVRNVATSEDLTALCEHVCGVFEDWIYALFRERDALSRPGNTHLYGLLCVIRSRLKGRLSEILARGFGHDPRQHPREQPQLFSGCYFAATGETPDEQAFVKGVFDKLVEEQENVEWTERARRLNRRYRWIALAGGLVAAATGVVLAGLLLLKVV